MKTLRSRIAVVTGASSGIGYAIAKDFLQQGMSVVIASQNAERLKQAEQSLAEYKTHDDALLAVATDVGKQASVANLAERAMDKYGAVHVLVNNAGVYAPGYAWEISDEDWQWVIDVNLWGTIYGVKTFMPILLEQEEGHIVNVSSTGGLMTSPTHGPYTATKHAMVGLSKSLRAELAMKNAAVGITLVCPGAVATSITSQIETTGPGGEPRGAYQLPPEVQELWNTIDAYTNDGIPADDVGRMVSDAILNKQFWLLPNGEVFFDVFDQELAEIKAQN